MRIMVKGRVTDVYGAKDGRKFVKLAIPDEKRRGREENTVIQTKTDYDPRMGEEVEIEANFNLRFGEET